MDVLEPPRLPSLGPRAITILSHLDETRIVKLEETQFTSIFPFETLFNVKQRIAEVLGSTPPSQLFIAVETTENHFKPLEFSWPFLSADGLINPHDPAVLRQPDPRIYEDGAKKPVFPTLYSGVTVENTALAKATPVVHVWTLESLLTSTEPISEAVFEGFIRLYFPQLRSAPQSLRMNATALQTLRDYRQYITARLERLEKGVTSPIVRDAELPELTKLYIYKCILPRASGYTASLLELKFYEMIPSPSKPFLRFFSAKDRVPSIIKVATGKDGKPFITNEKLLDSLMADQPSTDMGAIILIKLPINDPKVLGVCWTVRIYEDGSAEMYIGAPRRGVHISATIMKKAQDVLVDMLKGTPWEDMNKEIKLCELTAEYEFNTALEGRKPGKVELLSRVDTFSPLFSVDPPFEGETTPAAVILRYKGVSNYVQTTDPIMNYLTLLYLNRGAKTEVEVPKGGYIKALIKEFGISPEEAAQAEDEWLQRHSEYVIMYKSDAGDDLRIKDVAIRDAKCSAKKPQTTEEDTTVAAYNVGTSIRIYNEHPKYRILITGCESLKDLERMMTLMTLFLSDTAERLQVGKTKDEEVAVVETEAEIAANESPAPPAELEQAFDMQLLGMLNNGEDAENTDEAEEEAEEEEAEEVAAPAIAAAAAAPKALAPDEKVEKITKEWYLNKLKSRDNDLFQYTDTGEARTILYSRQCQPARTRQPNVLSKEAYRRAKELYGDKVRWIEVPLPRRVEEAYKAVVGTAVDQRKGSPAEILKNEKIVLEAGFPLKANKKGQRSITEVTESLKAHRKEIADLIQQQETKPIWIVTQTGTDKKHMNNYICTEYWCVRDDLPLLESEYEGTLGYDGKPKAPNTCPFCRGTKLTNPLEPAIGETVLERPTSTPTSGKVAKYSGFLDDIHHPDKFALPCCFLEPKHLSMPEGARQIVKEVEPQQAEPQAEELPPPPAEEPAPVKDIANRSRPFSSTAKTWYIPNQNVLGRIKLDWFELEKGAIAVPPASVNKFLGQNPDDFLTKNRGVGQQETNSHLLPYRENTTPAQAFIRYGIGHSQREPGRNFLSLLAWIEYSTSEFKLHRDENSVRTDDQMLRYLEDRLNGPKEPFAARAFEQANYGTLIHEFGTLKGTDETTGKLQAWCQMMDLLPADGGEIPAPAKAFYYAWHQFKAYVTDIKEPKELRLWESLLAIPGLFSEYGVLLVRIRVPKNKNDEPTLLCPQFGISVHDKMYPPPWMFLVEDEVTGNYDPLVLYDGKTEKDKSMYGICHFEGASSKSLPPKIKVPLQRFIDEYISEEGCGRSVPPVHPWLPVREMEFRPPSLTDLTITADMKLLRDRSNRLVGLLQVQPDNTKLYIPCLDDGLVLPQCASAYGEESLYPFPTIETVYRNYFTNMDTACDVKSVKAAGLFPKALRMNEAKTEYIAIDLLCGITIPIAPLPFDAPVLKEPCYSKLSEEPALLLKKGTEPWLADLALMTPPVGTKSLEAATKEEELEEAYQHLRITLSEFLAGRFQGEEKEQGLKLKAQIEKLRLARRRLPLFELQRRLDALLYPYVKQWVKRDDTRPAQKPSVLRRECTQITKETDCIEGCSWTKDAAPLRQCLIHTTGTERHIKRSIDPIHLMSARLTDELLRTFGRAMEIMNHTVSRLKPLQGSEFRYENSSLLFSAIGRGTQLLYDILGYSKRQPTEYTTGLTYPEEVGIDESSIQLPADWADSLYRIVVSPYLVSDRRAFLNEVMRLAKFIPADKLFHGTQEEWLQLAKSMKVNILKTHYNSITSQIEVSPSDMISEGAGDIQTYIILDVNGVPFQNRKTTGFTFRENELPASIKMALD